MHLINPFTPPTKEQTANWYELQAALAAKFARVAADCRREDEREAAANSIHTPGSDRWLEVMDSERGPDIDFDESDE
jgi:hypothetical protein